MHRVIDIFVYNIMRKRRTMYNLSETIVFFLALTNPRDRVQLEDISKKKIMKEAHFKSYPNGTKVR